MMDCLIEYSIAFIYPIAGMCAVLFVLMVCSAFFMICEKVVYAIDKVLVKRGRGLSKIEIKLYGLNNVQ